MNNVKVKFDYEDSGNCRTYYRTIPNNQLICLQNEGGAGWLWYTCINDGCWNEPNSPINMETNSVEITE